MSQGYQLTIHRHGKLLGHFQANSTQPLRDLKIFLNYLQPHDELAFELQKVIEDTRFLMHKGDTIQLLGTNNIYTPCPLDLLDNES
jgi:hypothetical protein